MQRRLGRPNRRVSAPHRVYAVVADPRPRYNVVAILGASALRRVTLRRRRAPCSAVPPGVIWVESRPFTEEQLHTQPDQSMGVPLDGHLVHPADDATVDGAGRRGLPLRNRRVARVGVYLPADSCSRVVLGKRGPGSVTRARFAQRPRRSPSIMAVRLVVCRITCRRGYCEVETSSALGVLVVSSAGASDSRISPSMILCAAPPCIDAAFRR